MTCLLYKWTLTCIKAYVYEVTPCCVQGFLTVYYFSINEADWNYC